MQEFNSKVDTWLAVIIWGTVLFCVAMTVLLVVTQKMSGANLVTVAVVAAIGVVLPVWVMLSTSYVVSDGTLKIRSGPFSWSAPIEEISLVSATRSSLSSPALSLDRLRITYSGGKSVMVSPQEKSEFLSAIGQEI